MDIKTTSKSKPERDVFKAVLDGKEIGSVTLNYEPRYSLYSTLDIPAIQDLYIQPDFRQKGYGATLIHACEQQAIDKGFDHIGISVGLHSGFGAAQRLYVKMGYIPDGFGVTYDREGVTAGEMRPVDDNLCLMMIKSFESS